MLEALTTWLKLVPREARAWVAATLALCALLGTLAVLHWKLSALEAELVQHKADHKAEVTQITSSIDKLTASVNQVVPQVESEVAAAQVQASDAKAEADRALDAVIGSEKDSRYAGPRAASAASAAEGR